MKTRLAIFLLFVLPVAHAELIDRGGGFFYDDVQDITWYDSVVVPETWENAVAIAESEAIFDAVRGVVWDDWRLPSTTVPDPSCSSPDLALGTNCTGSEMGHLYYVDGVSTTSPAPFFVIPDASWSGTQQSGAMSYLFGFSNGNQFLDVTTFVHHSLLVRDGDVGEFQPDADGDGVPDDSDNCVTFSNPNQIDTDGDGIGNACDADFNQDCSVNFGDLSEFKSNFMGADPEFDLTGDGFVSFGDLSRLKETFFSGSSPGPGPSAVQNLCPGVVCGDGIVDFPEMCDDGNLVNGDGCDNMCQIANVEVIVGCDPAYCSFTLGVGPNGGDLCRCTIEPLNHPTGADAEGSCFGGGVGNDLIVTLDLASAGYTQYAVDTCQVAPDDYSVAVFDGDPSGSGNEVACDEDSDLASFCAQVTTNGGTGFPAIPTPAPPTGQAWILIGEWSAPVIWDGTTPRSFDIELIP